jgi:hypothetical protein
MFSTILQRYMARSPGPRYGSDGSGAGAQPRQAQWRGDGHLGAALVRETAALIEA